MFQFRKSPILPDHRRRLQCLFRDIIINWSSGHMTELRQLFIVVLKVGHCFAQTGVRLYSLFPELPLHPFLQLRHDRQALLLMIRQALFIRHFFGSRLLSIDLADLIERITARLGIDLLQIGKLSSGVCQATAFDAVLRQNFIRL